MRASTCTSRGSSAKRLRKLRVVEEIIERLSVLFGVSTGQLLIHPIQSTGGSIGCNLTIPGILEVNLVQPVEKFASLVLVELLHGVNDFVHAHIFNIAELAALSAMLCRCRFLFLYKIDNLAEVIDNSFQFGDGFAGGLLRFG